MKTAGLCSDDAGSAECLPPALEPTALSWIVLAKNINNVYKKS
jgi:hypothetical protein